MSKDIIKKQNMRNKINNLNNFFLNNKFIYWLIITLLWVTSVTFLALIHYNHNSKDYRIVKKLEEPLSKDAFEIFNSFNHTQNVSIKNSTIVSDNVLGIYNSFNNTIYLNKGADNFTYAHEYVHHLMKTKKYPRKYKTDFDNEVLTDIIAFCLVKNPNYPLKHMFNDAESYYIAKEDIANSLNNKDTRKIVDFYLEYEFN